MANEHDAGRQELRTLEERVGRLEEELAELRRQMGAEAPGVAAASTVPPVAPASAKAATDVPPPPPPPAVGVAAAETPTVAPEFWKVPPPSAKHAPAQQHQSLESRLGSQIFNRIAIVLLLIGTAYGMKLAVDRGLIGPAARVIVGLAAGAGIVLWSERFRKKGFAAFSYSLKALGSGVLYLALWAAFHLYTLIPAEVALGAMVLVTAWNAYMSWAQNSELLAAYALAGGFATPVLLSTGGNHEVFLFTYLLAIDVATIALVKLRPWPRLLLGAFPFTVVYFMGWFASFYVAEELAVTSAFIALFVAAFASVPIAREQGRKDGEGEAVADRGRLSVLLEDILLPLANSAFAGLAFYSVLQDAGHHDWLPWLMLVLAAVYLGLMRLPQTAVASAMHLSIAVVFLTIAIPLKASGAWITVSWLVEGLALVWVATRLSGEGDEAYAVGTLRWLGMASLALGFAGVCVHVLGVIDTADLALWNKGTGTALTGVAVFAAMAWLVLRREALAGEDALRYGWATMATVAYLLIAITAGLLTLREIAWSWTVSLPHPALQTVDFAMAVVALAIFAGLVAASLRVAKTQPGDQSWTLLAGIGTIAFNFIAVLTGVREVSALFAPPPNASTTDAALQQALAISAFLMLYGAALLAVGFWRRSSFLRWQALALLLFTILKAFLYDMRNLSQGYRVVSLLALGALLLAVSFAYQKDWLNLRGGGTREPEEHAGGEGA